MLKYKIHANCGGIAEPTIILVKTKYRKFKTIRYHCDKCNIRLSLNEIKNKSIKDV